MFFPLSIAIKTLILAATIFLLFRCNKSNELYTPVSKSLTEAVYASGFVVSQNEYEVFSQAEGYVGEKLVVDGQRVKKGDPLYIIENGQQSSRYRLARESYQTARRNSSDASPVIQELITAIQSAKTKVAYDSLNFVRFKNLIENNATTQAEYDRMKLVYENAKNDYALQKSRLEKTRIQLNQELKNAVSQMEIATNESGRYIIRSEVDGMVFKTMKDPGELIRRTEAIAVVGDENNFYLQLSIDELDINRVKEGQKILVEIDAYPDKVFNASVSRIYPMVNQQQQSVRVDATLSDPLPDAFSGLAVEANIIIREKKDALVIPKNALLPGDSLLVKTDDGVTKIKVLRGVETLDEVEIVDGISKGQQVVLTR